MGGKAAFIFQMNLFGLFVFQLNTQKSQIDQ